MTTVFSPLASVLYKTLVLPSREMFVRWQASSFSSDSLSFAEQKPEKYDEKKFLFHRMPRLKNCEDSHRLQTKLRENLGANNSAMSETSNNAATQPYRFVKRHRVKHDPLISTPWISMSIEARNMTIEVFSKHRHLRNTRPWTPLESVVWLHLICCAFLQCFYLLPDKPLSTGFTLPSTMVSIHFISSATCHTALHSMKIINMSHSSAKFSKLIVFSHLQLNHTISIRVDPCQQLLKPFTWRNVPSFLTKSFFIPEYFYCCWLISLLCETRCRLSKD